MSDYVRMLDKLLRDVQEKCDAIEQSVWLQDQLSKRVQSNNQQITEKRVLLQEAFEEKPLRGRLQPVAEITFPKNAFLQEKFIESCLEGFKKTRDAELVSIRMAIATLEADNLMQAQTLTDEQRRHTRLTKQLGKLKQEIPELQKKVQNSLDRMETEYGKATQNVLSPEVTASEASDGGCSSGELAASPA